MNTTKLRALKPCGTEAAYQRHLVRNEAADDACRIAHAAHQYAFNGARTRALSRLAKEYPDRYKQLLAAELNVSAEAAS